MPMPSAFDCRSCHIEPAGGSRDFRLLVFSGFDELTHPFWQAMQAKSESNTMVKLDYLMHLLNRLDWETLMPALEEMAVKTSRSNTGQVAWERLLDSLSLLLSQLVCGSTGRGRFRLRAREQSGH